MATNHTTEIIFNKIAYKYTHTGSSLLNLNNKLNKSHTLVFFIGSTDWIGGIKPTSMKWSKNNKVDIEDSGLDVLFILVVTFSF